jgi:hypothetical protein
MIVDKASPLFNALGGMHKVSANARALAALKKGGPYPDGSQFVTDLHDFTVTDGSYLEGARKGLATMIKNAKEYALPPAGDFLLHEPEHSDQHGHDDRFQPPLVAR